MLEKKDYGEGLIAYCHFCNGFFNKENEFVEEGSSYWDSRYKRGYWTSMVFNSLIVVGLCLLINGNYWIWLSVLILPISFILRYLKLKKEKYFRD